MQNLCISHCCITFTSVKDVINVLLPPLKLRYQYLYALRSGLCTYRQAHMCVHAGTHCTHCTQTHSRWGNGNCWTISLWQLLWRMTVSSQRGNPCLSSLVSSEVWLLSVSLACLWFAVLRSKGNILKVAEENKTIKHTGTRRLNNKVRD